MENHKIMAIMFQTINQYIYWLVVSTPLNNMNCSQLGLLFPIYGKIKNVPVTTNQYIYIYSYTTICIILSIEYPQIHCSMLDPFSHEELP